MLIELKIIDYGTRNREGRGIPSGFGLERIFLLRQQWTGHRLMKRFVVMTRGA